MAAEMSHCTDSHSSNAVCIFLTCLIWRWFTECSLHFTSRNTLHAEPCWDVTQTNSCSV